MAFCRVWMKITCLSLLLLRNGYTLSVPGNCSRIQSHSQNANTLNYTEIFCCSGFELIGVNKCKECQIGYESNGSKCIPCKEGQYGQKCANKCYCQSPRCDHVQGCVTTPNLIYVSPTVVNGDSKSTYTARSHENHHDVIVYMCSIAGTGILLVAIGTIWKLRHGKQLNLRSAGKLFRLQNTTKWNMLHKKSTELHCNVYDYIDEKAMIKTLNDSCKGH